MHKRNRKNGTFINNKGKRIKSNRITVRLSAQGQVFRYTNVDKIYFQEIRQALKHASKTSLRGI